jgi:PAS domain S-box-containing protein
MDKPETDEKQVLDPAQLQVTLAALRRQLAEREAELERELAARRHLEQALQEAERSGQSLVENLSEVIYSTDAEGALTYASPAAERLLGWTPSEAAGRHISEFIHRDDLAELHERFQRVAGGQDTTSEYRVITKSGEVRWVRTSSRPVFEGERVIGVQGALIDMTEHKLAEEQIQNQNKFLMGILESLPHPFYVLNTHDYTIRMANPAARLNSSSGASTCYALTHRRTSPCGTADHPCPVEEIKRTKAPTTVEHIHYDDQGGRRHVEVHGYPVFDDEENVTQVIEYALDITERKEAEDAVRESEERWRSVTESSPDHVILLDRDLRIQFVNYASPGLTIEELLGTRLYEWVDKGRQAEIAQILVRALTTAEPDSYETEFHSPDGETLHYESRVVPRVVDDRVIGLAVNARDITRRKQAEMALRSLAHELGERVKELDCLYGISKLSARQGVALEELLQGTVELLPPAFQYPEAACARIVMEDQEFRTDPFEESRWKVGTDLLVGSDRIGVVEVYYQEEKPSANDGLFLEEERHLVDAVAERLGRIIERLHAEKAAQRGQREYRQLLDALQEGIWVIDEEANTTFVNPRMAEMLGYTVEEMLGKHLYFFMDERGIEITERNLARRAEGIREQHDFEFLRKDGSRISTLMETAPVYDDGGNYAGAIAGIQDITDRRKMERALRKSETLLNETQQMAKLGGWELDLGTSEVVWTDEVYRIHEVPAEFEPTLDNALEFYHPQDRPVLEEAIQRSEETGEPWDLELRFVTAKGKPLWVRAIGRAERHNGRVVRLSGTFQDITERKQAEQALEEAATVAERNRLARDLHDSVTQALFSASLVAEVLPQVWNRDPEAALEGVEDLRLLTRSALAEMRTMLLELRPATLVETRLDELLRQLTEAITSRAQLQVTFDIETSPSLPPDVHITFYRVAQEALNNAVKHAGAEQVTVGLQASPPVSGRDVDDWQGQVTLRISDDGQGFDPKATEGGQLGLPIMRERAEGIGADLEMESQPGQGTEIRLVWPQV